MPRSFRRSTGSRTAWFSSATTRNALTAGATESQLIWTGSQQNLVGITPTLLRIRGWVGVDPNFDPAGTGPSFWEWRYAITYGTPMTTVDGTNLEMENVLDTGMFMMAGNRFRTQLTAVGVETWGHFEVQPVREIDVKAKRQLRSPQDALYFNITSTQATGGDSVYSYILRLLVQIPR